ncbi:MAG: hypothetical protein JNG83_00390, partial [Opitutaceae bacterium]|nr:hypothetical protein [Opitutaceae bacterium]
MRASLLRLAIIAACLATGAWLWSRIFTPGAGPPPAVPAPEVAALEAARRPTLDPAQAHVTYQQVDYAEGAAAAWYPKGESPLLADLVREGALPPVAERVGAEPLVLRGSDGLGKYGGVWNDAVTWSSEEWDRMARHTAGTNLVRWSPSGYPVVPHVAKSWETSPDLRVWTFHLRRGMKWSDGHPLTADDFAYWYEWEMLYFRKIGYPLNDIGFRLLRNGLDIGRLEKVDAYTIRFVFPHPHPFFLEMLASTGSTNVSELFTPKHYLEKFHPELGDQQLIRGIMAARRFTTPAQVYVEAKRMENPEHPRVNAWIYRRYKAQAPQTFVRNPYYWAVDPAGNQLPYVDQITMEVITPELLALKAASGGFPAIFETENLRISNYGLYMAGRKEHGYDVRHYYNGQRTLWAMFFNLNLHHEPDDAITRQKWELLNRREFRHALSQAINRQAILRAEFFGLGEPSQAEPGPASPLHSPRLARSSITYDPAAANALLDGLGLTRRDIDGFRTLPDGSPMVWFLPYRSSTPLGPLQFVIDDWAAVGIRAVARPVTDALALAMRMARSYEIIVKAPEMDALPLWDPTTYVPYDRLSLHAPLWGAWYESRFNARAGVTESPPPPADHPVTAVLHFYEQAMTAPTRELGLANYRRIYDIAADELWSISLGTPPPAIAVVRDDFRNVPRHGLRGWFVHTPLNLGVETFYFERPAMSPGAVAQLRSELARPEPSPLLTPGAAVGGREPAADRLGGLLRGGLAAIVLLAGVLVGLRHPYIGRRLLLFIPVLLVVSVMTFVIIQIPPGDIIETRLLSLEQQNTSVSREEIGRIRAQFHLDDPMPERYLRWIGAHWFLTFRDADRGLLQGNLGLSMADPRRPQPVNELVGERILLTVLLSLGTILLTWTLALPIGIYSAVRQYSPADYALTFLGFVGMSVPGFLLALLLMYWG